MTPQSEACFALREIYTYANHERSVCERQADECRESKDYRAADRASSQAMAFQKIAARCKLNARKMYSTDLENMQ